MSYILDALRKSEAARRSREAPDLLAQAAAPLQPAPAARVQKGLDRRGRAVAALGLSALAVALWLPFTSETDRPGAAPAHAPDATGLAAEAAAGETAAGDRGAYDGMPGDRPSTGLDADASRSLDPGLPPGAIPGMAPAAVPAPTVMSPPAPAVHPSYAPTRSASAAETSMTAPSTVARTPAAFPAAASAAVPANTAPSTAATSTAGATNAASALPPSGDGRPAALADIAPELRRQLPPLRMSMHLWNEAPERRLLVLDGQRLREGDVLGEVVIERIDRNGAVLAWRGARIVLPAE